MSIRTIIKPLGFVFFFFLTSMFCMAAFNAAPNSGSEAGRSDGIFIKSAQDGLEDEMPHVLFFHDLHTEVLEGKDCSTCHLKKASGLYKFEFKETSTVIGDARKEMFHENCIGCHNEMRKEGEIAGPDTENCRGCHQELPETPLARMDLPFDKSLHYRHESSKDILPTVDGMTGNCGNCHHEYDDQSRQTVYKPGKEGACIYCHKETDSETARAIQTVSHESCLNCHKNMKERKISKTGPVNCQGCHASEFQKKIEIVSPIPRMKRNQPDAVLMAAKVDQQLSAGKEPNISIAAVAFNHKIHENNSESCRACHHASLEKCSTCHTSTGDEKGEFVTLEKAMHSVKDMESCSGCHNQKQKEKNCAGCHSQMGMVTPEEDSCKSCHRVTMESIESFPIEKENRAQMASEIVAERRETTLAYTDQEIPEKVSIGVMQNEYMPAVLPHRKIVKRLLAGINKNQLGVWFHSEKYSMCMGCHHNSPMTSGASPACASCHSAMTQKANLEGRPNLKGAYHGQCIGCHEKMGITEPAARNCTSCHKKKI